MIFVDSWPTRGSIFFRRFIIVSVILPLFLSSVPPPSLSSISIPFRFILRRCSFLSTPSSFLSIALRTLYRKRRTKETVTSQLAKLLIYSLFNQINERVDMHFYAPVQLFMVYGNCPKQTRTSIGRGRGLTAAPCAKFASRATALFPFAGLRSRVFLTFFITFLLSFCPFASSFTRLPRPTIQSSLTAA